MSNYINEVLEKVSKTNAGEPEFNQAVKEVLFKYDSELTSKEMQLKIKIYKKLLANCKKMQELARI